MGFFSFKTGDTGRSIMNSYTDKYFPVVMMAPDGRRWEEPAYGGYGIFGGKDIYELLAELNGKEGRHDGIKLFFGEGGSFGKVAEKGYKVPKLAELHDGLSVSYEDCGYSEDCPMQGFFCDDKTEEIFFP